MANAVIEHVCCKQTATVPARGAVTHSICLHCMPSIHVSIEQETFGRKVGPLGRLCGRLCMYLSCLLAIQHHEHCGWPRGTSLSWWLLT
jgi:hypothetical protein